MIKINVIANTDVLVPYESRSNAHIDDTKAVEVPKNAYYMRRINEGDLLEVKQVKTSLTSTLSEKEMAKQPIQSAKKGDK